MPPLPAIAIFIALALLGSLLACAVILRQRAAFSRLRAEYAAQARRLDVLERDLGALLSCSRRIGDRIGDGERNQRTLQKQLDKLHLNNDDQLAAEHAMKLLNSGMPMNEVTRLCDLTEGEVEILSNLTRHRQAA